MLEDIVVSALGQSAAHRLAILNIKNKKKYLLLLGKLASIGVALGLGGYFVSLFWGKEILSLFFRPEYADYANVLAWLMLSRLFINVYSFVGYGITAARKFKVQVLISGLMTGSLSLACWFLVPSYAGVGAAWATIISALVALVASLIVMRREFIYLKEKVV
ncbi:MAG: hypothetical protein IH586_11350 [Anaerolineaceae bacterium]|nr:hypothetical protein [Anaerolineaceae bacterium]